MRQAGARTPGYARAMRTKAMVIGLVLMTACTGDEAPSCQQATTSYYASGCRLFNASTNPPTELSQTQAQLFCQDVNGQVPDRCEAEFDDWKSCLGSRPDRATTNADCDCSREQDALFGCQ